MPSNISRARFSKAFNEGRRAANDKVAENPYENPKLRQQWEKGRSMQLAGQLTTPIPPLEHGETRARRVQLGVPKPPRPKPPFRPRDGFGPRRPGSPGGR